MYTKTAAGTREVADRSLGLPAIQRRALILVDGRRGALELARLLCMPDAGEILAQLEQAGLVERPATASAAPPPLPPPPPPPPELDPDAVAQAKAMMRQSTSQYLGVLGAPLQDVIASARNRAELVSVCARWHMEMRASRRGREEADALLSTLHALLQVA